VRAPNGHRIRSHRLWLKAPVVLVQYPGLLLGLAASTLLLVVTVSSYPVFITANASELMNKEIAADTVTRYGAGVAYVSENVPFNLRSPGTSGTPLYDQRGQLFSRLASANAQLAPTIASILGPSVTVGTPKHARTYAGRLFSREGALDHIDIISGGGAGVWLPDLIAGYLHVSPGTTITLRAGAASAEVLVAGVYSSLYTAPRSGFWRQWDDDIYRSCLSCGIPPQFVLTSGPELIALSEALGIRRATFAWQAPIASGRELTLDEGRRLNAFVQRFRAEISDSTTDVGRVFDCCHQLNPAGFTQVTAFSSAMPTVMADVESRTAVIQAPAGLLRAAGIAVSLIVIAAGSLFGSAARRTELQFRFSRGGRPLSRAVQAVTESLLPCVTGGLLGLGLALALLGLLGPSGPVARSSYRSAIVGAGLAVALGIVVVAATAALAFPRLGGKHPNGPGALAHVPFEVPLVGLALYSLHQLRVEGAFLPGPTAGVQRPSLYVLLFPLAALAGAAVLGSRLLMLGLRWAKRKSQRFSSASYLAVHRLAAGAGVTFVLIAGAALCFGVFLQALGVSRSLRSTVEAKAKIFVGSDVQGRVDYRTPLPERFPLPLTRVTRRLDAGALFPGGGSFDLLAIDPATLPAAAFWDPDFSRLPLTRMTDELMQPTPGSLPIIVAGADDLSPSSITISQRSVPVHVVGHATAFPGMSSLRPFIVVDAAALLQAFDGAPNPLVTPGASTEFWVKGAPRQGSVDLTRLRYPPSLILTAAQVENIPAIAAVVDTFLILDLLGLTVSLLVIAGALVYLQARERSRLVSYGLSLRMGMTHRTHRRALTWELSAMLIPAYAVGLGLALVATRVLLPILDPFTDIPPRPLIASWIWFGAATLGTLLALCWASAWLTNHRSRVADFGQVMRVG
jgi:putative ABC transport system permease protein